MFSTRLAAVAATALLSTAAAATLLPQAPVEPTANHEVVVKGAGSFEGTMTMWMPGVTEPMKAPCTEVVTAIGDLWTTSRFEMNFMGMDFVGSATFGYDDNKKMFVGTWVDSMTTTLTVMEGDWNEDKSAIVMEYDMFEPMVGETVRMRSETVMADDSYSVTFFRVTEDGPQKQMAMDMKRAES